MPTWTSRIKGHDSSDPPPRKAKLTAAERRKQDHEAALEQIARMREIVRELGEELEENKQHVLSIKALERLEEIDKLSQDTRARLRR
jgi:hypothetical protein